jgi:hypothetical protein
MSLRSKALAAAAALALIAAPVAAGATAATAATPSCGANCVEVFNHDFGSHKTPAFVLDTYKQGETIGTEQILYRVSNSDPAEDYTVSYQGLVSDLFGADLVSAAVNLHYGCDFNENTGHCGSHVFPDDAAFEVQYSPYGVDSGLCAGVAATASAGEKVTLQPCGDSARTAWIVDSTDTAGHGYVPFINGSDNNFSQPYVLTYPADSFPTDNPRPQLEVTNLTGSQGANGLPLTGTINSNQEFGVDTGVLP